MKKKSYEAALAAYEAARKEQVKFENEYISQNGIINPDGTIPYSFLGIQDVITFDKAMEAEFDSGVLMPVLQKFEKLRQLEIKLIRQILDKMEITPEKRRKILQRVNGLPVGQKIRLIKSALKSDIL